MVGRNADMIAVISMVSLSYVGMVIVWTAVHRWKARSDMATREVGSTMLASLEFPITTIQFEETKKSRKP